MPIFALNLGLAYNHRIYLAAGAKLGLILTVPPVLQLTVGTCVSLTVIGGTALQLFYSTVCTRCFYSDALTVTEWYLVFACLCMVVALLPNLNSISYVSLVGAIMAVAYCTLLWTISVNAGRPPGVTYARIVRKSDLATTFTVLVAIGNITFAFRGHNLIPEIQVCNFALSTFLFDAIRFDCLESIQCNQRVVGKKKKHQRVVDLDLSRMRGSEPNTCKI